MSFKSQRIDDGSPFDPQAVRPLPADVVQQLDLLFPETSGAILQRLLEFRKEDASFLGDRLIRCLVFCLWRHPRFGLEHWLAQAASDPRDLIVAAEYDPTDWHIHPRDFNQPFRAEQFSTLPHQSKGSP